ncbi:MAG: T9SS type A sorting domain-containing protein [Bacteroidia bacterium]
MKKTTQSLLAALLFAITFSFSSNASHLMGGEIGWRCVSGGQYLFKMKVYRDCYGIPFGPPVSLDVHNYPGLTTITMNLISQTDISGFTSCDSCGGAIGTSVGVVEEFIFESNPITLSGTPPTQGWIFSYSNCCRNTTIDNLVGASSGSLGFTLRTIMYSVNGQSANPCYDSSPDFAEKPATTTGAGYDFHYTPFANDGELDSLEYTWAKPLDQWTGGAWTTTNPFPLTFSPGFTYTNPIPGPAFHPLNSGVTLNSHTGEIIFRCFTPGIFVAVNKVTSYKCGVKCSEIYRDMRFAIIPGNYLPDSITLNSPPVITPPFIDPNTSLPTLYDTVYEGDFVTFPINAIDFDFHSVTLEAAGSQFGGGFTDTAAGCLIPPCAILNPPPPLNNAISVSTTFQWQTTPDHLGMNYYCAYMPNTHYFLIRAKDDFCPVHAFSIAVIAITVLPPLPKPVVTQSNDTLQTASITGYGYQWYKNRFKIPGETSNAYKTIAQGYYQVRIVDTTNNSGNYSDSYHPVFTGINSLDKNTFPFIVSPNPSKGKFTLSDFNLNNFELTVTDRIGKIVYQKTFSNYNSNTLSIELKNENDGIYFVQLKSDLKSYQTKVVIRK